MFDLTSGSLRTLVKADVAETFLAAGCLVVDHRRSRPFWFDGRFLTARDLNREQDYFLTRQADLADAAGSGVAEGLLVEAGDAATRVRITPGHGVCAGGARVLVPPVPLGDGTQGAVVIDLADVPVQDQLNAALGTSGGAAMPSTARSGLFVLALRPIEFTAGPVGRYPTKPGETIAAHDGETVEAALVTLIPFPEGGAFLDEHRRRSDAARRIFLAEGGWTPPANCLPLALLALDRNQARWIDPWLVRRRLGDVRSDPLGLGQAPRPAREAHLVQYHRQLDDVLRERSARRQAPRFAAAEHFAVLPPAGRLPAAGVAVEADGALVQHFFPAEMDVDLAVVPEDELATVVEESFVLPPVPLTGSSDELAATAVLVLIPVPRGELRGVARRQVPARRPVLSRAALRAESVRPVALMSNLALLRETVAVSRERLVADRARLSAIDGGAPAEADGPLDPAQWRSWIAKAKTLWYVRRRAVAYRDALVGRAVPGWPDEGSQEEQVRARVRGWNLVKPLDDATRKATAAAAAAVIGNLAAVAKDSELVARAALSALKEPSRLDLATVSKVFDPLADGDLVEMVRRVEDAAFEPEAKPDGTVIKAAVERNRAAREKLGTVDTVRNLAAIARKAEAGTFDAFAAELKEAIRAGKDAKTLAELVAKQAQQV